MLAEAWWKLSLELPLAYGGADVKSGRIAILPPAVHSLPNRPQGSGYKGWPAK